MKKVLFLLVGLMLSILPLAAQNKTAHSANQTKRTEVHRATKSTQRRPNYSPYSYKTSQKTMVTTAKGNSNKIVALQWANLRIVADTDYLRVYQLKHRRWKRMLISKNTPGTHHFDPTYTPDKFDSRTVVVTVPEEGGDIKVSVNFKGAVKETFTLRQ